jgi:hypothetical protein
MTEPPVPQPKPIAGAVLPLAEAEALLRTLPSVVSARIIAHDNGELDTIHLLVTGEVSPKQVVRNVESALIAQLGMQVDHRKISVAATVGRPLPGPTTGPATGPVLRQSSAGAVAAIRSAAGRTVYFEDVEFRGSRTKGSACRVTLRRGDQTWVGEAEGIESSRSRAELAARAALAAVALVDGRERALELVGVKKLDAFDGTFLFVAVETRLGRERTVLTGSCEVRESAEVSAALAVLDATNRWLEQPAA